MPINLLNLNFGCGQTLNASDLTQICSKINEIIGEVNEDTVYSPLEFSVDSEGYWTINGLRVKDSQGNDVKATSGSMSIEQYSCGDNFPTDKPIGTIILKCNELYMYDGENWVSIGQSEGEGNYTHMAYAYDVLFSTDDNDYDLDSNTSEIIVSKVTGFTINPPVNRTDYRWIGICISNNILNPGNGINSGNSVSYELTEKSIINKYKWNFLDGKDGNGEESVYMRTKVNVKPTVVNNNVLNSDIGVTENLNDVAENGDRTQDEFLPLVGNIYTGSGSPPSNYIRSSDIESNRWFDDLGDVDQNWLFRWQAKRKKINGVWQPFGNVVNAGNYTESAVSYRIDCTIPSLIPPNNSNESNFNPTLTFYKAIGQSNDELFECHYAIYSRTGNTYIRQRNSTDKVSSVTISSLSFNFDEIDSFVIFISDIGGDEGFPLNSRPVSFYKEREICKLNREVTNGKDAVVYSLSCSPSSLSFRKTTAGDMITSERDITCQVIRTSGNNTPVVISSSNYSDYDISVFYRILYSNNSLSEWITNLYGTSNMAHIAYNSSLGHIYTSIGETYYNIAVPNSLSAYISGVEFALSISATKNDTSKIIKTITVDISAEGTGAKGNNGYSNAQVYLYTSTAINLEGIKPSNIDNLDSNLNINDSVYYRFSNLKLYTLSGTTYTELNEELSNTPLRGKWKKWDGFSELTPANGESIYITTAIANANAEYDEIAASDWVGCIKYEKGKVYNCHKITLYTRDANPEKPSITYYYKFSDGFLYSLSGSQYSKLNTISVSTTVQGLQKTTTWYYNFPQHNGNPCYFIQTTALGTDEYDVIESNDWIGPDIAFLDGSEGQPGSTGKMFYSMGIWKDDVNYSTYYDDLRIPMVFYDDRDWNSALNTYGSYYFFNEELESEYIEIYSRDDNGTNLSPENENSEHKKYWIKAENYGLIFTQGIFSEFAKLGSAIMSGDYIMSQEGRITKLSGYTYNMPDYTYFLPTVNGVLYEDSRTFTFSTSDTRHELTNELLNLNYNMYIKDTGIRFFVGPEDLNSYLKINCSVTTALNISNPAEINFAIGTDHKVRNKFASLGISGNGPHSIDCGGSNDAFERYRNLWVNIYIYVYDYHTTNHNSLTVNGVSINISKVYFDPNYYFEPNWSVDLKSGKMIAGQSNFIVNPEGTVYMKSFILTENYIEESDFEEFNNNFTIGSGGLSTEIKLYKLDCTKAGVYVIRSAPSDLKIHRNSESDNVEAAVIIDSSKYNDVLIYNLILDYGIPVYSNDWQMSKFGNNNDIEAVELNAAALVIRPGGYIKSMLVNNTSNTNNTVTARYISTFGNIYEGNISLS